ncbi:MAG: TonB-dependent receptor [Bacteroidota bacterium]
MFSSAVWGQSTGAITGYVTDAKTGETLPGATVQLEGTNKGTATDENGYYRIENIPPKTYTLTFSFVGYQPVTKYNVVIKSGGNPDINAQLTPSTQQLDEITVGPDPFQNPVESPLSRKELSQVEIESYPGGNNDIAKVVQSLPGVSGTIAGFRNDVIIRGGAPSENVYYLDEIEIPVINHFATQGSAGGPVGLLNVSFFEGFNLSSSSFNARYNNALSGVLQFDQRNGNASEYQANLRVGASEAAITAEGPLFKNDDEAYSNTTFIASIRRSYLQLLFDFIGLPFLPDYWDYQYKINHQSDEYNEFKLIGVGSIDNFKINKPEDITAEQQATLDQVPVISQWSTTHGLNWTRRFKEKEGNIKTTVRTTGFNNQFSRYRDNEQQEGLILNTDSQEWLTALKSEYNRFIDTWTVSAGVRTEYNRYNTSTFRVSDDTDFDTNLNFLTYGLFAQVSNEWFNGRFKTSLGVRSDGNTFTKNGNKLWQTLSPRLALSYGLDPENKWKINATVGRYYKIPPNTILGYQDTNSNFFNKDSGYIQSNHYVAGITFSPRKSTQLSVEGFLKQYRNYPVSVADSVSLANLGGGFEVFGNEKIKSVGKGRAYGAEVSFQQKLQKNFYAILAYTLYWSEFSGFDQNQYLPSLWDNRHLLTFTGGYKLPNNWEIGTRLRILGGSPYAPIDRDASLNNYPDLQFDYSGLGDQRLDPFNSLDIRIDKKWNFPKWSLNLYLDVQNVLFNELPSTPEYGLRRNEDGSVATPREIVEIENVDNTSVLPTLGVVIDI